MKLTDEDVDRIAEALARKLRPVPVHPAPYVLQQPVWYWQQPHYPAYPTVYCSGVTAAATGTLIN